MAKVQGSRKGGSRKLGRKARKTKGKGNPLALFVRGLITAETYFKQTKQKK